MVRFKNCETKVVIKFVIIKNSSPLPSINVIAEEGGGSMELKPNSRNIPVTAANICEYVRLRVALDGPNQADARRFLRLGVTDAWKSSLFYIAIFSYKIENIVKKVPDTGELINCISITISKF